MEKSAIAFASHGDPGLLIFTIPEEFGAGGVAQETFAIPIVSREGGLILCVPNGVLSEEARISAMNSDDTALLGPSKVFPVALCEETEEGNVETIGQNTPACMIDVNNDVLLLLQDYNPAEHGDGISVFDAGHPGAIPVPSLAYELVVGWVNEQNLARTNFYSAREEPDTEADAAKAAPKPAASKKAAQPKRVTNAAVMEQLAALAAQVQLLSARQDAADVPAPAVPMDPKPPQSGFQIPAVSRGLDQNLGGPQLPMPTTSKALQIAGPPPRTRHGAVPRFAEPQLPPETEVVDPVMQPGVAGATTIENALFQQSTAITSLVAQLASQADPLSDLATTTSGSSSTKGVQRREKMQQDLAMGSSGYYLQVMQQIHKRMFPSSPVPRSGDSLAHLSFLEFLEKNGGYKQNRESGLLMWLLGYALDAAAQENMVLVKERLALMAVALDQSVVDNGDWTLGFLLSLAEDPPIALFQEKTMSTSPYGKPFSPLVPPSWITVVLSYMKEMEIITTKKGEMSPKKAKSGGAEGEVFAPSPRRKARFPRKPKAEAPPPAKGA